MSSRILILGAAGRIGSAAAGAFRKAGWTVASQVRPGAAARAPKRHRSSRSRMRSIMRRSPRRRAAPTWSCMRSIRPITDWSQHTLPLAYSAIMAAETAGATLLFPGNLYNYGSPLPPVIDETTPMRPTSRKGQLRVAIEERMRGGGRARRARDRSARRRFLRRRARLLARPGDRQGDRQRPRSPIRDRSSGARMGLPARSRSGAWCGSPPCATRSRGSRRSALPAMR